MSAQESGSEELYKGPVGPATSVNEVALGDGTDRGKRAEVMDLVVCVQKKACHGFGNFFLNFFLEKFSGVLKLFCDLKNF